MYSLYLTSARKLVIPRVGVSVLDMSTGAYILAETYMSMKRRPEALAWIFSFSEIHLQLESSPKLMLTEEAHPLQTGRDEAHSSQCPK